MAQASSNTDRLHTALTSRSRGFAAEVYRHRYFFLMLLPAVAYFAIFRYAPIYGVIIAFKDYSFAKGILGSEWVGLEYFRRMFSGVSFWQVFRNTLIISLAKIVLGFPMPILFAILLNEVMRPRLKRTIQTVSYLPHFLSWVILGGVIRLFLSRAGPINQVIMALGGQPQVFMGEPGYFLAILVLSHIYNTIGWGSIVYLAAISSIDPQLYEAAQIDGATRLKQMRFITFPSLIPVISIMFLLRVGDIMDAGFNQVLNLYSPAVYSVGDIIDTYAYRVGLIQLEYSFSTAVNLFKNVLGLIVLLVVNATVNQVKEYGLW